MKQTYMKLRIHVAPNYTHIMLQKHYNYYQFLKEKSNKLAINFSKKQPKNKIIVQNSYFSTLTYPILSISSWKWYSTIFSCCGEINKCNKNKMNIHFVVTVFFHKLKRTNFNLDYFERLNLWRLCNTPQKMRLDFAFPTKKRVGLCMFFSLHLKQRLNLWRLCNTHKRCA